MKNKINNKLMSIDNNINFVMSCKTYDAYELENYLHHYFRNKNVDLEWFDLDDDIQTLLDLGFNYALED